MGTVDSIKWLTTCQESNDDIITTPLSKIIEYKWSQLGWAVMLHAIIYYLYVMLIFLMVIFNRYAAEKRLSKS